MATGDVLHTPQLFHRQANNVAFGNFSGGSNNGRRPNSAERRKPRSELVVEERDRKDASSSAESNETKKVDSGFTETSFNGSVSSEVDRNLGAASNSCSTEQSSGMDAEEPAPMDRDVPTDAFLTETAEVVLAFLRDRVNRVNLPFPNCNVRELSAAYRAVFRANRTATKTERVLIAAADAMERRNGDAFLQLATRLPVDAALPQAFEGVLEDVFLADGSTDGFSFGRLIAVFAYAGRVAVECVTKERGNYVWMIVVILIKLIFERLRPDMERLGGWAEFTREFSDLEDREDAPSGGRGLRRFLSHVACAAGLRTEPSSEVDEGQVSPSLLVDKMGWMAAAPLLGFNFLMNRFSHK